MLQFMGSQRAGHDLALNNSNNLTLYPAVRTLNANKILNKSK